MLGHARIRLAFRPDGLCRSLEDLTIQEVWSDMVGVVAETMPNIHFDPTFLIWKALAGVDVIFHFSIFSRMFFSSGNNETTTNYIFNGNTCLSRPNNNTQ